MGLRSGHGVAVENNTPLILAPTGTLVDQLDEDPGKRIFDSFNGAPPAQSSLRDLISAIEDAKTDARIPFAVLKLDGLTNEGLPQLQELVTAMNDFRANGKKIIPWRPSDDRPEGRRGGKKGES